MQEKEWRTLTGRQHLKRNLADLDALHPASST
jgi:hypothetical protein